MLSRLLLCLGLPVLLLCIGIQCITFSVGHEGGRLHYHVSVSPEIGGSQEQSATAEHRHAHRHVALHKHWPEDLSVVEVTDNDQGASPTQPAPPARAQDLGGLLIWVAVESSSGLRERWPPHTDVAIRSFISSPLERPPSA